MNFLAHFIFCWFGWTVGPWEVILLVAYLMYTVEPALRIGRGTVWGDYLPTETRISGNAVSPVGLDQQLALGPPAVNPGDPPLAIQDAGGVLAIQDSSGAMNPAEAAFNRDAPASENSSNASMNGNAQQAAARSAFEGRMHTFVLNLSNAVFGSTLKLVLCGFLALPCEFRLFTRLGAVTILVPLLTLPCIFILVPTALVLFPIREKPDLITLSEAVLSRVSAARDQ